MPPKPKMTITTQLVLRELLREPGEMYGRQIATVTGLASGTVTPILERLESVGWLTSRREAIDPVAEGRPARRYYRPVPERMAEIRRALAGAHTSLESLTPRIDSS